MAATSTYYEDAKPNTTPFSVEGKRAIVTGAGSGINFSFASLLLSRGCSVLFADLSLRPEAQQVVDQYSSNTKRPPSEKLQKTKNGIVSQGNNESSATKARAVFVRTDVTVWKELENMFNVAEREFGGVDIVCPGAGIYDPHWSNFWHPPGSPRAKDAPDSNGYASIDINIVHPIRSTQLAISHFLNAQDKVSPSNPKRVVIISSIAGQMSNLNTPIYVAGKHAMNGFIRSLGHLDERLGIRVNGVAPGVIKTPLWTEHPEKMTFLDEKNDEWATPEEVAEAMVRCLTEPELGGGTILEVGAKQTRRVAQLNDPGPSGAGHTVGNIKKQYEEVFGWLREGGWGKPPES